MKYQAKAVARVEERQSQTLRLIVALSATAIALATLATAHAQTATPAPLPPKTESTGPTVPAPAGTTGTHRGIIRPPAMVDRMTKAPPYPHAFPTPIIRPPAASGTDKRVVPK